MAQEKECAMALTFEQTRALFDLPPDVIYLDGNSLGPPPRTAAARVQEVMQKEWGGELIKAWNTAGWYTQPRRVGDRIARLIGAETGSVIMGDTLSIKVYQALAAALGMRGDRRVILSDTGNFPSDLYMAQGLIRTLGLGHRLSLMEPEAVMDAISTDVAAVLITEVDYRTGRRHNMREIIARAHAHGALVIWDLAHSAGAFPLEVAGDGADFAVGCSYKYLNGGPGAPAFIYVAPRHAGDAIPALSGWMGHDRPFAFAAEYHAASGIERMRVGTPPVLALAALEAALDIWDQVDMQALRARSLELTTLFMDSVERACPLVRLMTPRQDAARGSQVSFAFEGGYAAMQALIDRGIIGDFRAPDIMRFGICPLFNTAQDIRAAADALASVVNSGIWKEQRFQNVNTVT